MYGHRIYLFWLLVLVASLGVGVLLAWLAAKVSALAEGRRLSARHTVIAEYDAPSQLSAAELGYIIDATFGTNELLATIAQLYAKGAVQLRQLDGGDFLITPSKEDAGAVDDAEASVLGYLRGLPEAKVAWSQLKSVVSDVAGEQADFADAVLGSLVAKGLLYSGALSGMLLRRRLISLALATACTVAVGMPLYLWGHLQVTTTGLNSGFAGLDSGVAMLLFIPLLAVVWFIWFVYANLLIYIYTRRDGIPTGATEQLQMLWPDVAGFRLFLQETEYVRLQHDRNARDPSMAYCLALGLDPGFIRSLHS